MLVSEYIIWKCETRDQIKREHPDWTEEQIEAHLLAAEDVLKEKGFFD